MSLSSDLTAIKNLSDGVKNNKVTRFAYTQNAYNNNDVNGHSDYVYDRDNNIPTADLSVIEVNPTVVDKGFRARASSLPRMLLNHLFGRISYNLNKVNDLFNELLVKVMANMGVANGLATLDANGRIPYSQLPEDAMEYQGEWNAQTNTPHLVDGTGTRGDTYNVSVAGTQNLGSGNITFFVGDRVIYNENGVWQRLQSGAVRTVSEIAPDINGNVDLSEQSDITKLFNADFLDKLLFAVFDMAWQDTGLNIRSIAYGNGVYIACGTGHVYKSSNGADFTEISYFSSIAGDYDGVAYGNGKFILTARGSSSSSLNKVWSSVDYGDTWQDCAPSTNFSSPQPSGVFYVNGLWQLLSNSGAWWSEDGATWTKTVTTATYFVDYINGLFVLGSNSGALWSNDGKSWTAGTGIPSRNTFQIIYAKGVFVACHHNGIYWSVDGKSWTLSDYTTTASCVAYNGSMFIAGDYNDNKLLSSVDGKVWTEVAQLGTLSSVGTHDILVVRGNWFALQASATYIYTSKDGQYWKKMFDRQVNIGNINSHRGNKVVNTQCTWNVAWIDNSYQNMLDYINGE